jgi:chitodextrinase
MQARLAAVIRTGAFALALALAAPGVAVSSPTSVTLSWTAPGDDDNTGTAALYDVRYSTAPIDAANFTSAYAALSVPTPHAAGTNESMTVTGLSQGTTYWFAIRTRDDAGNWSPISNVAQWTTDASSDTVRPAPLTIALGTAAPTSVSLDWTAVGDDSLSGMATLYEVRWSTSPITPANWPTATLVTSGVSAPGAPGSAQACTIAGLDRSVDLWFAVRVADEVNNWSPLSNVISVPHTLDTAPPSTPSGLAASVESDGEHLHWNDNGDPDLAGYHVYRAPSANGPWTALTPSAISVASYVDGSAPDSASLWYAVTAVDASNNESARSASVQVWLHGAGITAVKLQPAYPNPSTLSSSVSIPVDVPGGASVDGRLDIVNSAGEHVRSIAVQGLAPGTNTLTWDGRNDAGRMTAPGIYRAMLHAGGIDQAVRLVRQP